MRRSATSLLLLCGLLAAASAAPAGAKSNGPTPKEVENALLSFISDLTMVIQQEMPKSIPPQDRRRLATIGNTIGDMMGSVMDRNVARVQTFQEFMADMLGTRWVDMVPQEWTLPTFDWGHLGEFEYSSTLGNFLETHDLRNLTDIESVHDLARNYEKIEEAFCDKESFSASKKVPASCTGPSVTIALVPKVCILESKTKQILCDPAKLVLTKTPGSCIHKYMSASTWVGKECKISGGAGFSDSVVIGGDLRSIPLIDIDIGYEF